MVINDPPSRSKRTADTDLVPVVLDLSTDEDIMSRIDRIPVMERLRMKAVRLCEQAHQQGALLSNADLAELMTGDASRISSILTAHERNSGKVVPRRATLHEMGSGITH